MRCVLFDGEPMTRPVDRSSQVHEGGAAVAVALELGRRQRCARVRPQGRRPTSRRGIVLAISHSWLGVSSFAVRFRLLLSSDINVERRFRRNSIVATCPCSTVVRSEVSVIYYYGTLFELAFPFVFALPVFITSQLIFII